jgi:hypothetical protein
MINRLVAKALLPYLISLPFAERTSGLVKTIEKKDYTGKGRRPTFPASQDIDMPLTATEYADMSPNSKYKSVIFLEDYGCKITGPKSFSSTLRLMVWANVQKVELDELGIIQEVLETLPHGYLNIGGLTRLNFLPTRILGQEERIFSRYSFEEATRQYLMLPYVACAIELTATFNSSSLC